MSKYIFFLASVMLMGVMSVILTACDSDDGDDGSDGGGSINPSSLVGWAFEKQETSYGGSIETVYWAIEFKTINFVVVKMQGNGIDEISGKYRWNYGDIDCMYRVSGNQVIIDYTNDMGTQQIVLKFVNGTPEGWAVSKRGSNPITMGGGSSSGSAAAGSSQMYGYYSSDNFYNGMMGIIRDMTSAGDYFISNWKNIEDYWGHGYQITDGNTINMMYEAVEVNNTGRAPQAKKGWNPVVYHSEQYSGMAASNRVTIYVFFYYLADYDETYKYVMNGSNIEMSNGKTLQYKGSQLVDTSGDYTYTKR